MLSRRSLLASIPVAATAAAIDPTVSMIPGGSARAAAWPLGEPADLLADGDPELVISSVPRAPADPTAATAGALAIGDFSARMYGALAGKTASPNAVCSPYSVAVALAMARAGAKGVTASEMDKVLAVPGLASDAFDAAMNSVDLMLTGGRGRDPSGEKSPYVTVVNSLWAQRDMGWERAFLDTLARWYGAGVRAVDYKRAAEAARVRINEWVSANTNAKIPELLAPGALTTLTRLVLVNAVYLKASWSSPFDPRQTVDAPFHGGKGTTPVKMMNARLRRVGYKKTDSFVAVDLPYVGGELAMAVVLPRAGDTIATLESAIDGKWLTSLLSGFPVASVRLSMPRWTFRLSTPLAGLLAGMGMPTAFTSRADFSGITRDEPLRIDTVVHEAFIGVDEKGTEAAAATAIGIGTTSIDPEPIPVVLDRPFLFVIHEVGRGVPLFIGRVGDPAAR